MLGDLLDEEEQLTRFLQSTMKVDITPHGNDIFVTSEELSPEDLKQKVTKFVYHRNLNHTYWISLQGGVIKFNRFKPDKKPKKAKKKELCNRQLHMVGNNRSFVNSLHVIAQNCKHMPKRGATLQNSPNEHTTDGSAKTKKHADDA